MVSKNNNVRPVHQQGIIGNCFLEMAGHKAVILKGVQTDFMLGSGFMEY